MWLEEIGLWIGPQLLQVTSLVYFTRVFYNFYMLAVYHEIYGVFECLGEFSNDDIFGGCVAKRKLREV